MSSLSEHHPGGGPPSASGLLTRRLGGNKETEDSDVSINGKKMNGFRQKGKRYMPHPLPKVPFIYLVLTNNQIFPETEKHGIFRLHRYHSAMVPSL